MENYLYTAYTLYKWDCKTEDEFCKKHNDCQTMVNFYTDKIELHLTDGSKDLTISYKDFLNLMPHNNFYDIEYAN